LKFVLLKQKFIPGQRIDKKINKREDGLQELAGPSDYYLLLTQLEQLSRSHNFESF